MAEVDLTEFDNLPDTSGMGIIEMMMAEHERIMAEADDLQRMCLELMTHGQDAFDLAAFQKKVRFIRGYADAHHHKKEEDILYSYMTETLGQVAENLIQHGMLVEHDRTRACVKKIEEAAAAYAGEPTDRNRLELIGWAMEYVHLIGSHIQKENAVVYPFAERSIAPEVMAELTEKAQAYQGEI